MIDHDSGNGKVLGFAAFGFTPVLVLLIVVVILGVRKWLGVHTNDASASLEDVPRDFPQDFNGSSDELTPYQDANLESDTPNQS